MQIQSSYRKILHFVENNPNIKTVSLLSGDKEAFINELEQTNVLPLEMIY